MSIVDIHAHVSLPAYSAMLSAASIRLPGYRASAARPMVSTSEATLNAGAGDEAGIRLRLQFMDDAGVDRQVLSPTVGPYAADSDEAIHAARLVNDTHASLTRKHPDRFSFFAALPLPHVDAALAELERSYKELGAVGAALHCSVGDRSVADESFEPLFAELDRRAGVLFLHPAVNGLCSPLVEDWGLAPTAGAVFEDTVAALHLITRGVPARFPRIKIVVPHLGGALPMLLERLDNQLPMTVTHLVELPSLTARRLWYDTVGHGSAPALRAAAEAFGTERLVFGSDYPVMLPFETYAATVSHLDHAGLAETDVDRIRMNAHALLRPDRRALRRN